MIGTYIPQDLPGRHFVVSDIHGCLRTFKSLLFEKIQLKKEDQLFLLGDYVHRGPDSKGVLDLIMDLQKKGYAVFPLKGNHEVMYLNEKAAWLPQKYVDFIKSLPYYIETRDFYFVHAGFNFAAPNPLEDTRSMLWGSYFRSEPDMDFLRHKKVIHGHTKHSLSDIFDAVVNKETIIPLDNGCYEGQRGEVIERGNLCAIDLDKFEVIVQENIDVKVLK